MEKDISTNTQIGKVKAQEVEPIKNYKDIQKIKQYLLGKDDKRDYCLFVVGINIGLRASDLLSLQVRSVVDIQGSSYKIKEEVHVIEKKTGKSRHMEINSSAGDAMKLYLESRGVKDPNEYLFKSQKGSNNPLTVGSLHKIIKNLLRDLKIKGNYGTHTLRKTFAYHIYINNINKDPGIVHTLMKMLNHSTESMTLRYIGITKQVIKNVYVNLNL